MLPRDCVEERIERLKQPSAGAHGWRLVVDDLDANELCSASDIFNIQIKLKVLTTERQRLFSKRAREYMVAYNTLDNQEVDAMDETKGNVHKNPLMSAYLIEKIVKQYKTHRSAADFDSGFVDKVVDAMKGSVRKMVD